MKIFRVFSFLLFVISALCLAAAPGYAVERSASGQFNWGDDLSEDTVNSPGGATATREPKQFKTNHIPDIKSAIDQSVTVCGISSDVYSQTDREAIYQIGRPGQAVSSKHVNNLRRAIERLYSERGDNTVGNYFTGSVNPGDPIRREHIHQMRRALDHLAESCVAPGQCGGSCIWIWNGLNWDDYCSGGTPGTCLCTPAGMGGMTSPPGTGDPSQLRCDCAPCGGTQPTCVYRVTMQGNNCGANAMNIANNYEGRSCTPPDRDTQDLAGCMIHISCVCQAGCLPDGSDLTAMGVCQPGDSRFQTHPDGTGQCCSGWIRQSCAAYYEPWEITCASGTFPCGNGLLNAGEQCDDGNTADGDGCSATCTSEVSVCPPGSTIIGPPPLYDNEQGCLSQGNNDCSVRGMAFAGTCGGSFQPCCIANCESDGYTWNRGGLPRYVDELILDERCCSGAAVCYGGTTTCSCGRAGGGFGGLLCGNGTCGPGETCLTCPGDCGACPPVTPVCGNGVLESGESCDAGAGNGACPAACSSGCTVNSCGGTGGGTTGPCGAANCYTCGGLNGARCVQDNTNGEFDDPSCYGACEFGDGGIDLR